MTAADQTGSSGADPLPKIGQLLSSGYDSVTSVTGIQLTAAVTAFGIIGSILAETLFVRLVERSLQFLRENADMSNPIVSETVIEGERGVADMGFGLDVSTPVLLAGLLVVAIAGEAAMIVAIRAFANDELRGVPLDLASRRLPIATLYGFLGGVLLAVAVGLGLVLFVVPGLVLFVGTLFFRQEIALADSGPIEAVSATWAKTKAHRWTWALLVTLLFVIGVLAQQVTGLVTGRVATIGSAIITGAMTVFSIAVVTEAYVTLHDESTEAPPTSR